MFCKTSFSGKIDYGMIGTNINTFSAGSTFMVINYCKVVLYVDGIVWAYLLTLFTSNTRILTNLFGDSTFIKRFATHMYHF